MQKKTSLTLQAPPSLPRSLIVTADDFGFGVATSRGIILAHQAGVVTATSMMAVTGDHAKKSVPLLADAPELDVGLHLVLTGENQQAMTTSAKSKLTDRSGKFHSLKKMLWLSHAGLLHQNEIEDEIAAQAEHCGKLLGKMPAYVDGHHHAHQLPIVRDALVAVMNRGLLPKVTRCSAESKMIRKNVPGSKIRRSIANHISDRARPLFAKNNIWMNDCCFGMVSLEQLNQPMPWADYFPNLESDNVVEWFVHPGELDAELDGRDTYIEGRARELEIFLELGKSIAWQPWKARLTTKSKLAR